MRGQEFGSNWAEVSDRRLCGDKAQNHCRLLTYDNDPNRVVGLQGKYSDFERYLAKFTLTLLAQLPKMVFVSMPFIMRDKRVLGLMKSDPDDGASERQGAAFEFGSALLAMTACYGVEALAIGSLPNGDNAFPIREQSPSTVAEPRLLPVCSKEVTYLFLKTKPGKEVRHVICATAARRDEEIARAGKGLAVIICGDDGDPKRKGVIFFGSEIRADESTGQHLAMIAHYAFTRMTTILGLNPIQPLTVRQIEVLSWAAEGKTDQEIAMILGLSDHTIDNHMNRSDKYYIYQNVMDKVATSERVSGINVVYQNAA